MLECEYIKEGETTMKFGKYQIITMGALICAILFNPMAVEILDDYFKIAYSVISVLCTLWVLGYLLKKIFTPEKVNIPKKKKSSKVHSQQYLEV